MNSVLNVKALAGVFNQEKALIEAFSVITNLRMDLFQAIHLGQLLLKVGEQLGDVPAVPGPGLGAGVGPQLAVAADPHPREEARHAARQLVPAVLRGLGQGDRQGQYHLRRRECCHPSFYISRHSFKTYSNIPINIDDFNSNFLIPLPPKP